MNLKLIRIAFRIFKMIKFTITIHAYVNETTPEEQKELERIKKQFSDSMKK